ncbi:MAG: hypothetical protein M0R80_31370 [Proteobacteria bacterium]|nr:hypothetical protein [Pseudomonadota bacterium]
MIMKELGESGSSKLERRLYNCSKFVKGGETQRKICKELNFNPISMTHHLAKHQNPDENVLIQKKYEANLEKQRLKHEDVRQKMMEVGMEELEAGNIKMNASVLRGVAKDTSDIEEKNKDRQLKVLEMLNAFISGEITNTEVIDADSTESPISYLEG